jgi:large subunit ribosomal protein L35
MAKPKMKSHGGVAKRVKVTGTGKLRRRHANLNHLNEKKSARRTRRLSGDAPLSSGDEARMKRLLAGK